MHFKFLLRKLHIIMCPPQNLLKPNLSFRFKCKNNIYWSIREPIIATKFNSLCFTRNLETSISVHPVSDHEFVFRRIKEVYFLLQWIHMHSQKI